MIHHYQTQYTDEWGCKIVESWLQINVFKRSYCFSKRKTIIEVGE